MPDLVELSSLAVMAGFFVDSTKYIMDWYNHCYSSRHCKSKLSESTFLPFNAMGFHFLSKYPSIVTSRTCLHLVASCS